MEYSCFSQNVGFYFSPCGNTYAREKKKNMEIIKPANSKSIAVKVTFSLVFNNNSFSLFHCLLYLMGIHARVKECVVL